MFSFLYFFAQNLIGACVFLDDDQLCTRSFQFWLLCIEFVGKSLRICSIVNQHFRTSLFSIILCEVYIGVHNPFFGALPFVDIPFFSLRFHTGELLLPLFNGPNEGLLVTYISMILTGIYGAL